MGAYSGHSQGARSDFQGYRAPNYIFQVYFSQYAPVLPLYLKVKSRNRASAYLSTRDFNQDIGREVVEGMMTIVPDEWKGENFKSAMTFNVAGHFHAPGIVYAVDLVVAVPSK